MVAMLSERQIEILRRVISEYVREAEPVASRSIAEAFSCSSATVRNEFQTLTDLGLLDSPHTSAGRIPTAKAYRWLLDQLLLPSVPPRFIGDSDDLSVLDKREIAAWETVRRTILCEVPLEQRPRLVAKFISQEADAAAAMVVQHDAFYYTGLSRISNKPEFREPGTVQILTQGLDSLERALIDFVTLPKHEFSPIVIRVGREQFTSDDFSILGVEFGDGNRFVLFGPMRQDYPAQIERLLRARDLLTFM